MPSGYRKAESRLVGCSLATGFCAHHLDRVADVNLAAPQNNCHHTAAVTRGLGKARAQCVKFVAGRTLDRRLEKHIDNPDRMTPPQLFHGEARG
jgi:hypothetical protein